MQDLIYTQSNTCGTLWMITVILPQRHCLHVDMRLTWHEMKSVMRISTAISEP